jgi:hypothetical protein
VVNRWCCRLGHFGCRPVGDTVSTLSPPHAVTVLHGQQSFGKVARDLRHLSIDPPLLTAAPKAHSRVIRS